MHGRALVPLRSAAAADELLTVARALGDEHREPGRALRGANAVGRANLFVTKCSASPFPTQSSTLSAEPGFVGRESAPVREARADARPRPPRSTLFPYTTLFRSCQLR